MSSREKREQRIRSNPSNVSLEDFEALIRQYGDIIEGARHQRAAIGRRVFPYRRTNPVRSPYVKKILEMIDNLNKEIKDE